MQQDQTKVTIGDSSSVNVFTGPWRVSGLFSRELHGKTEVTMNHIPTMKRFMNIDVFCMLHSRIPVILNEEHTVVTGNLRDMMSDWAADYISALSIPETVDLCKDAEYAEIGILKDVCLIAIANSLVGKRTEEMRKIGGIQNDYTPAEEAANGKRISVTNVNM